MHKGKRMPLSSEKGERRQGRAKGRWTASADKVHKVCGVIAAQGRRRQSGGQGRAKVSFAGLVRPNWQDQARLEATTCHLMPINTLREKEKRGTA